MNYRNFQKFLALLLALVIVGCGEIDTPSPPTATVAPTDTARPTETISPTATESISPMIANPSPTPIGKYIPFLNWQTDFCNDECGQKSRTTTSAVFLHVIPGKTHEAAEVLYDVKDSGWVLIKKNITPEDLARTKGVSFSYKGIGASNSIELKLLLHYPGDAEDTTFGVIWKQATDTGDQWKSYEALYERDFKCWGPAVLCAQHNNVFDMSYVHRLEFGISNKGGDSLGLGRVTFDELILLFE